MKLNIILNKNIQNIIGVNNELLVTIKKDLEWFKEHTINSIIVMGYNTFKSLPGNKTINPLKNRLNIVISNNHYNELLKDIKPDDHIIVYRSFKEFYNHWVPNKENGNQNFYELNEKLRSNLLENYKENIDSFTSTLLRFDFLESYKGITDIFVIGGGELYKHVMDNYKIDSIYETLTDLKIDIETLKLNGKSIIFFNNKIPIDKYKKTYEKVYKGGLELNSVIRSTSNPDNIGKEYIYTFSIYQHKDSINEEEMQYLELLKYINMDGKLRNTRNSKVLSMFSPPQMRFDLRKGFPLLTSKRIGWKTVLRELLWFINGSTNNKELQEKNVHIWDGNSTKEYMESRGLYDYKEGDLGPIYGFQWRHSGAEYLGSDYNYEGKGVDQLKYIINEIKENPTSRRIIINSWNPKDLDKMALPPCHIMVQFNIDIEEKYIDAKLTQRSGDMFLGVPFNIASYSMLLHIIGNITGYKPRYLIHDIGDAHIYEGHKDAIEKQLQRKTFTSPIFKIKCKIEDIDTIDESIFEMINYKFYPTIKASMSA